jgi:hypothetical protein
MRRNWLLAVVVAGILGASASAQAADGSIAVYLDDAGTQCEGMITAPLTFGSVWMELAGATAGGITVAEFRITNSDPSAYSVTFVPDPAANAVIGDPMLAGVDIAFPSCQGTLAGRVKLGQLLIVENVSTPDVNLTVRQHFTPSNEFYPCPLAVLCDAPNYTKVCLGPFNSDLWRAWLNPSDGVSGICEPVGVEETTWSQVKSLFGR